jgi:aminoglycoside phosphotransferase (APT) family kinase protein
VAAQSSGLNSAEEVRAAVESALGKSLREARVDSAGMGARNSLWRIRGAGYDWMARIAHDRPNLHLDVAQEYAAQSAAAAAGMAPEVILARPEQHLLVMGFVPAALWSAADVRRRISHLASRLRALHALAPPPTLSPFNLLDGVSDLVARALSIGAIGLDGEHLRSKVATLAERYQPVQSPVFCHNDLHHLNMLGEKPLFVDWEYAAVGDPHMDLAAVATYHDFDVRQRTELLRRYGGRSSVADFDVVCALFDALHVAWLVVAGVWDDTPMTRRATLLARVGLVSHG